MIVRNNYNECLTNLACSIKKYFGLEYHHQTLPYVDQILIENKPQNVLLFLLDDIGSNILKRTLTKDDFLIKYLYKDITSVFPATTTAATTSIRTGLNPVEHGWLAWNTYLSPIDKTITLFLKSEKGKKEISQDFMDNQSILKTMTITEEINQKGLDSSIALFPFPAGEHTIKYDSLKEFEQMIIDEINKPKRSFIYAYNDEPDHTMHLKGPDSKEAINLIKERNDLVKKVANKISNTLIIVVADHGHLKIDNLFLKDYPDIKNMLERVTSLEPRAVSFKVKEEYYDVFKQVFNEQLGEYFSLYTKEEVIESQLFGDGNHHPIFEDALGDFIAIAETSNKTLLDEGDEILYSTHAGYTDDEIFVPLILKLNK